MKSRLFLSSFILLFLIEKVSAHCPLCTVGAGAAAAGAVWLGVSKVVVALFIGAFAMSMGMWFARFMERRKKYIPFQYSLIIIAVFLLTVWPLIPIVKAIGPLYLPFIGAYGKTYAFNYSLASSLLGGLLVFIAPATSRKLTDLRNGKMLPFQGIIITFLLLIIAGGIIQLLV
ncbi:MAG TPA: hypothetical protein ENH99_02105 [Candidatus Pacearchaeota archaeon]|nr:hypothetical protein [Candidatus Pacearchaeota archaeon]